MKKFPAVLALCLLPAVVWAHGTEQHGQMQSTMSQHMMAEQHPWGMMGNPENVDREIRISMTDNMRFTPDQISVKLNETIRFVVENNGKVLHEFVLGTPDELQKHAEMMKRFPNMAHDEPYMAHVDPARQGEVVWTFNQPGEFEFACLLPGHFEAGMKGQIVVQP
ncbi:MAG: cupredoxin family protein [Burkholderiaceae bacterium]|nr:cupredoxin family protein [Burkholderiaceae bacterium]